ncbi:MAG: ABC transporter permease, partial [Lachnospiraceae bacterium]|nr:ABC transporter permease [Lachnospiraceae bacterium]
VGYWNTYFDALIYIQDPNKYTLQLRLKGLLTGDELNNSANLEGIGTQVMSQSLKMATVAISTIPILIVYPWLQKYFVKGVMIGSVKG